MYLPVRQLHLRAGSLVAQFKQGGGTSCFDEAIVLDRDALQLCPLGHPNRSTCLTCLGIHLGDHFVQLGATSDLQESIVLVREALDLCPAGKPDRSMHLNTLAHCLYLRFNKLGAVEDCDEAISLDREALDLRPKGHPNRSWSLIYLASHLSSRLKQLGAMEHLDEPIVLAREALDLRAQGHPDRIAALTNLGAYLSFRYEQLGAMGDLDEAIVLAREALDLRPQGHPLRSSPLDVVSQGLSARYNKLGAMQDLDEAIVLVREALNLRPQGHSLRFRSLNYLAVHLSTRYKQLGAMEDLDEAIVLVREVLELRPQGHPLRSGSLNSLANALSTRYKRLGVMHDLDEAIALGREALDLYPQRYLDRSELLDNLAGYLCNRFTRLKQLQDKEEMFSLYAQLVHVSQIVSSNDLSAATAWIHAAEEFRHPTILLAYETSLRLLIQHLTTLASLPRDPVILTNLTPSLAVDAFSACLRERAPARAVELLEQDRGVFWSQLTRLHSPLEDVVVSSPAGKALADEFTRLGLYIRNVLKSPGADKHERLCHLNLELERIVTNIRKLPGFSRFLLPSESLFPDLQRAASGGPVIIVNASKHGCDALIVFLDRDPVHIPLQITQEGVLDLSTKLHALAMLAMRGGLTRGLKSALRKLWDQIVSPIVDFLQTTHPCQSRIWWCPTAEFSALPLHAAGPYRKGQQNLPDLYISSYTPTLTALIRARRRDPSKSATEQKRFLAIGRAKAAGARELLSAGMELDTIRQSVDGLATFACVYGKESCISRVVEGIGKNEWVHLACRGLADRKQPFESTFALHDGHFTIQRIIGCDLKNAEFAYLSACQTDVGDEESLDEVIHLASAMQFAGFRSVIGTMWAVDDGATIKIASTFYKHMVDESGRLDHTRAAFALNKAMKSICTLDQQMFYFHVGA